MVEPSRIIYTLPIGKQLGPRPLRYFRKVTQTGFAVPRGGSRSAGKIDVKPGASVYAPKLIPQAWHDVGATPGKMLVVAQPAGPLPKKLVAGTENRARVQFDKSKV
jgi:hypothetical protein